MGKIAFECALISPLVISLLYDRTMSGIYITVNEGVSFLAGNIISNLLLAIILYLIIEYPAQQIIKMSIGNDISHDK